MGATRITREQWEKLLVGFREKPGNAAHAARQAGLEYRTAQKAWRRGWDSPPWARCIREVLDEEKFAIRAQAVELEAQQAAQAAVRRDEREVAKKDAITDRARETQAAKAAMSTGLGVLAIVGQLQRSAVAVSKRVAALLEQDAGQMSRPEAMAALRDFLKLSASANLTVKRAMEIVRVNAGDPSKIIGHKWMGGDPSVDAARAVEMLGSEEAIERAAADLMAGNMTPDAMLLLETMNFGDEELN